MTNVQIVLLAFGFALGCGGLVLAHFANRDDRERRKVSDELAQRMGQGMVPPSR